MYEVLTLKQKQGLLKVLGYLMLGLILCIYFVRVNEIQDFFKYQSYITGDWFINYANGIVRRGLFGEAVVKISQLSGADPIRILLIGKSLIFLLMCGSIFLLALVKGVGLIEILMLVSPWALMFDLNDPLGSGRKEILLFASYVIFCFLEIFNSTPSKYFYKRWDFYFLLIVFIILSFVHEGLVFFFQFFYLPLFYRRGFNKSDFFCFFVPYSVSIAILLALYFFFKGNFETVVAIRTSLENLKINMVGFDAINLLAQAQPKPHNGFLKTYIPLIFLSFLPLYLYGKWTIRLRSHLGLLMLITIFFTTPLYVIAIDWGRWIHITALLFFILFYSLKDESSKGLTFTTIVLVIVIAIPYIFYWRIPHTIGINKIFFWWSQDPLGWWQSWYVK